MKTLGIDEEARARDDRTSRAWLVRIGSAGAPLSPPAVFPLAPARRVVIGRQDGAPVEGDDDPGERDDESERIDVPDPWMSSEHAEIEGTERGFELRDLGSSNGTLVLGQRAS